MVNKSILTGVLSSNKQDVQVEVGDTLYCVYQDMPKYAKKGLAFYTSKDSVGDDDAIYGFAVFKGDLLEHKEEYLTPDEMISKFPDLGTGKIVAAKVVEELNIGVLSVIKKNEFSIDPTQFAKKVVAPKGGKILTFDVKGSFTLHSARPAIIAAFNEAEKPVYVDISLDESSADPAFVLTAVGVKGTAGEIATNSKEDLDLLAKAVKTLGKISAKVTGVAKATYSIMVQLDAEETEAAETGTKIESTADLKSQISELGTEESVLNEIEEYLTSQNIEKSLVKRIFRAHKKYPEEFNQYISKKPKTPYIDNQGLLARVISYTLGGTSLRLHGDASTGKNVLLDTLSWIFQKPLFQKPVSSQIDKFDIFGSKGFESRVDEEGNQINEVMFQKELLIQAMEIGGFYNLDEVNLGPSEVLELLNPVLDYRKAVDVSGFRRVVAAEGFNAFATMNPSTYTGTRDLNEAFASRFGTIRFRPNTEIKSILAVHDRCSDVSKGNLEVIELVYKKLYELSKEEDLVDAKVLSLRLYAEAAHYSEDPFIGIKDALIDNVAGILDDDDQFIAVCDAIDTIVG